MAENVCYTDVCVTESRTVRTARTNRDVVSVLKRESAAASAPWWNYNSILLDAPGQTADPPEPAAAVPACSTSHLLCPRTSPHVCVAPNQICNGFKDCPDGSDEDNCVQQCPTKCKSLCSSALFWPHICHWLIPLKLSCCFLILNFSSSADFLCKDHRSCVPKSLVCDGRSHCYDGSDETSCPSVALHTDQIRGPKCRRVSRLCRDGTECVLFSHVCDGERDCRDGSDEEGCGEFLWRVWDYWRFKQG